MDHSLAEKIANDVGGRMFAVWYGLARQDCSATSAGVPKIVIAHDETEAIARAFPRITSSFRFFAVEIRGMNRPVEVFADGKVLPVMGREWEERNEQFNR
jgi:hypothetical protein